MVSPINMCLHKSLLLFYYSSCSEVCILEKNSQWNIFERNTITGIFSQMTTKSTCCCATPCFLEANYSHISHPLKIPIPFSSPSCLTFGMEVKCVGMKVCVGGQLSRMRKALWVTYEKNTHNSEGFLDPWPNSWIVGRLVGAIFELSQIPQKPLISLMDLQFIYLLLINCAWHITYTTFYLKVWHLPKVSRVTLWIMHVCFWKIAYIHT